MGKKEIKRAYKAKKKTAKRTFKANKKSAKQEYKTEKTQARRALKKQKYAAKKAYREELQTYRAQTDKPNVINPPKRSVPEEIGNAVTHGVGAILAILALLAMLFESDRPSEYVAACIYSFGLIVMCTMSCLYHSFRYGSAVKRLFRRFDYCCIYLLIGATFAPLLLCYIGGALGITFFCVQWAIIATGITLIGVFGPTKIKILHYILYFVLGWSALLFIPQMIENDVRFFLFILGGGIVYSLGVIPFLIKKKASHFIWHFFVLAGATVQWVGIYLYLYL